jgi:serine protease Do
MKQKCRLIALRFGAVCLFCFFLFLPTGQAAAQGEDAAPPGRPLADFSAVVKQAAPAVVYLSVEKTVKAPLRNRQLEEMLDDPFLRRFFGEQLEEQFRRAPQKPPKQEGSGSGFIISEDGLILTNNHVVEEADKIIVKLADKREFKASVVGTDPQSDVALIKIDGKNLPALPLGDSNLLEVGEWVIAIGSPFDFRQSVTVGVVSAKGRSGMGISEYENFIQTDAAINPGNSGGPLLNSRGQAVGINTAIFSPTGSYMGIGFAIPINMAKSIEEQLRSGGKVVRGWLGLIIQDVNDELAKSFELEKAEGILVSEVTPGSPAEKAGLKQGDVVLSLNGALLSDVADLRNRIASTKPGSTAALEIIREGRKEQVQVEIAEQPADFSKSSKMKSGFILDRMGLTLQELTPDLAERHGYSKGQGVFISEVEPDSPAGNVGLEPGQLVEEVNQMRVRSLADLKEAVKRGKNQDQVLLRVRAGEYSRYVALRAEE